MTEQKSQTATRPLIKKLCEVMSTVQYIQKLGYNEFHKYHYATEADVSEAIRKELADRKVFLLPSIEEVLQRVITTKKGNEETVTKTRIKFTFLDAENGDSLEFVMEGEGQDPGDKGIYKAITGTTKYALMKAFLIPTGDDPEGDKGNGEHSAGRVPSHPTEEVDPTTSEESLAYPDIALPPPGTKGINDVRAMLGHAQTLGWTEQQIMDWVEKRTKKAPCELNMVQAKALKDAIKKEKKEVTADAG